MKHSLTVSRFSESVGVGVQTRVGVQSSNANKMCVSGPIVTSKSEQNVQSGPAPMKTKSTL